MAKYVCERDCTFRPPNAGYDTMFTQGQTVVVPDNWKGRQVIGRDGKPELDKDKKPILIGVPRHFRKLKANEEPEEAADTTDVFDDPLDAANAGDKVALSDFSKQDRAPDGTKLAKK